MKAFIDTNIFVYASYSSFPQFDKARSFLKSCLENRDQWFVSWSVIYEYLRVVTQPQLFKGNTLTSVQALENVENFIAASHVSVIGETEGHLSSLKDALSEKRIVGTLIHDLHNVVLMKEHDIPVICTTDADFYRLGDGVKIVNPLK